MMKSKTPRLSRSGIEYLDYAWGIYSGCTNWANGICGGGGQDFNCWARSITQRFPAHYPNGFEPTWYPEAMLSPLSVKKPSIIAVGWMGDMFLAENDPNKEMRVPIFGLAKPAGTLSVRSSVRQAIWGTMEACPQHRFLFLTKCYWNLKRWSPFPSNAWVGVTITDGKQLSDVLYALTEIEAGLVWLSVEPMLGPVVPKVWLAEWDEIGWVTAGAATQPKKCPKPQWVEELVYECQVAAKPIFLKDNLVDCLPKTLPFYVPPSMGEFKDGDEIMMFYRQEIPDRRLPCRD